MITHDNLLTFLGTQFAVDLTEVDCHTELFTGGILDSFSIVELVLFVESEEKIKMDQAELVMENLDSIAKILRFCDSKRARQTLARIPS